MAFFMKNILLISPHPDDIEIFMGGTAAKLVKDGHAIRSIIITDGRRSPRIGAMTDAALAEVRRQESIDAHRVLGITSVHRYGLQSATCETLQPIIEHELALKKYDEIYLPHPQDAHPTHALVAQQFLNIITKVQPQAAIWAYDGWNFLQDPDHYKDISDFIEQKLAAIRCHRSQVSAKSYDEVAEHLARLRALLMASHGHSTYRYAEAFARLCL